MEPPSLDAAEEAHAPGEGRADDGNFWASWDATLAAMPRDDTVATPAALAAMSPQEETPPPDATLAAMPPQEETAAKPTAANCVTIKKEPGASNRIRASFLDPGVPERPPLVTKGMKREPPPDNSSAGFPQKKEKIFKSEAVKGKDGTLGKDQNVSLQNA